MNFKSVGKEGNKYNMTAKHSNIVLVEDDQNLLELLAFVLRDEGYTVKSFSNPQFKYARKKTEPKLYILDAWIGNDKTGLNQAKYLESFHDSEIPSSIIVMSSDHSIKNQMHINNKYIFLPKPFKIDQFLELVQKTISPQLE